MSFKLTPQVHLGKLVLNVQNLWTMLIFYQTKIGLDVLDTSRSHAVLGLAKENRPMLELRASKKEKTSQAHPGLYHFAILLPSRRDLANILFTMITQKNMDIQGASDQGFSESICLEDPERNTIELTRDKDPDLWPVLEDGTIPSQTKDLDVNGLLDEKDVEAYDGLPEGTRLGHIHLMVSDLDQSRHFYQDQLGFDLKYDGDGVLFFAAGFYHHQLALNAFTTEKCQPLEPGQPGLSSFSLVIEEKEAFDQLLDRLTGLRDLDQVSSTSFKVTDPDGLAILIQCGSGLN